MYIRKAWNEGEIEAGTLLDEIERLRAEASREAAHSAIVQRAADELRDELAAAQAREQKMRAALESAHSAIVYRGKSVPFVEAMTHVSNALQIKCDDSALRERIAAELERVADDAPINGNDLARARVLIAAGRMRHAKTEEISKSCS